MTNHVPSEQMQYTTRTQKEQATTTVKLLRVLLLQALVPAQKRRDAANPIPRTHRLVAAAAAADEETTVASSLVDGNNS
jgi:hypothetical protein